MILEKNILRITKLIDGAIFLDLGFMVYIYFYLNYKK